MSHNIVLITGANRGLGRAISECLARAAKPYTIVMTSRSISAVENAAREITVVGLGDHNIVAKHCDMEDERSIHSLVETMNELYGRIDVLINNAGESTFSTRSFYSETPASRPSSKAVSPHHRNQLLPSIRRQKLSGRLLKPCLTSSSGAALDSLEADGISASSIWSRSFSVNVTGPNLLTASLMPSSSDLLHLVSFSSHLPSPRLNGTQIHSTHTGQSIAAPPQDGQNIINLPPLQHLLIRPARQQWT